MVQMGYESSILNITEIKSDDVIRTFSQERVAVTELLFLLGNIGMCRSVLLKTAYEYHSKMDNKMQELLEKKKR